MLKPHADSGLIFGLSAYILWGLLPLYLVLLTPAMPLEVAGLRVIWTNLFCLLILVLRRDWSWFSSQLLTLKTLLGLVLAAGLLAINWGVYIYAVATNRAAEGALGYFLNPLVSVALGVVILGERLRRNQWIAVGIAAFAGGYLVLVTGGLPWIAIVLSVAFAIYGLIKKRTQITLAPIPALWLETAFILPVAFGVLGWLQSSNGLSWPSVSWQHTLLIIGLGPVTAIPLLLFAQAARTLQLTTLGMLQFVAPTLHLVIAVWIFHEPVSGHRWLAFILVWISLVLLTWDAVWQQTRSKNPKS